MKPLGQRQLFGMKRETLEARLIENHAHKKDSAFTIQSVLIALIRNALSPADFSFLAKELICTLFLEKNDLQEVKELCVYFRPYFTDDQWGKMITRLFPTPQKRSAITEQARLYSEKFPLLHSGARDVDTKASLLSTFLDEHGKKHSWTLSNVDPNLTSQQHEDYLSLLTTLTILQKDGVRRFTAIVEVNYILHQTSIGRRTQEEVDAKKELTDALPRVATLAKTTPQKEADSAKSDKQENNSVTNNQIPTKSSKLEQSDSVSKQPPSLTETPPEADPSDELNDVESVTAYMNQLKRKAAGNPPTREERKRQNQINKALGKKGKKSKKSKKNKRRK